MAQSEVIQEFLVGLGYSVNETERRKWNDWLSGAAKGIAALVGTVKATALAVEAAVVKMSSNLEELYWASQRTKASADNIRAFGFAVNQMGGTVDGAMGSLEAFASFLRSSPGAGGLVRALGVTTEENGRIRDTTKILSDLGARFREMPFFQARAYASVMGIDERTLMAMINGLGEFSQEYRQILGAMRVDLPSATRNANALMTEFRTLGTVFSVLGTKIINGVSKQIKDDIASVRQWIIDNSDRIASTIEYVIRVILALSRAVVQLGSRVVDGVKEMISWFNNLSPRGQEIAKVALGLAAAIVILNTAFMKSPVGIVVALAAAIATLWDDYKTFKEGGDTLIDWAKWEPALNGAIAAIQTVVGWIDKGAQAVGGWENVFTVLLAFVAGRWAAGMIAAFARVGAAGAAGLVGSIAKLPVALLRLFGLGGVAAAAALLIPSGSGETSEHTAEQPGVNTPGAAGGETMADYQARILAGNSGAGPVPPGGVGHPEIMRQNAVPPNLAQLGDRIMTYFMNQGWTRDQSAGIVANLVKESSLNHQAVGDGGMSFGLAQWNRERLERLGQFISQQRGQPTDARSATFDEQLAFIQLELKTTEKRAGDALANARNPTEAGQIFSTQYERPRDRVREAQERGVAANRWADRQFGPPESARQPGVRDPSVQLPDSSPDWLGRMRQNAPSYFERMFGRGNLTPSTNSSPTVTLNQETSIVVNGSGDPRAAANMTLDSQARVNADLQRNVVGAVR